MDNSTAVDIPPGHYITAWIYLIISVVGLAVTSGTCSLMLITPTTKNSFGFFCVSQGIADCGVLFIFLIWSVPTTFRETTDPFQILNCRLGDLTLLFWFASVYSMMLATINRLCAIILPLKYEKLFSNLNTRKLLVFCWFISVLHAIVYNFDVCHFSYFPTEYKWNYDNTDCANFLSFYVDFCWGIAVGIIALIINFISLIGLRISRNVQSNPDILKET